MNVSGRPKEVEMQRKMYSHEYINNIWFPLQLQSNLNVYVYELFIHPLEFSDASDDILCLLRNPDK